MMTELCFAQITLNFDVLNEEPAETKQTPSSSIQSVPVRKVAPVKKVVVPTPKKAKPAKKPVVKKLVITESKKQDAHDRLKPRAEPVPVVKIIVPEKQKEPEISNLFLEQQEELNESPSPVKELEISKRYLEQQQTLQKTPIVEKPVAAKKQKIDEKKNLKVPVKTEEKTTEKVQEKVPAKAPEQTVEKAKETDVLPPVQVEQSKPSVLTFAPSLTQKEGSKTLEHYISSDCATKQDLLKNKLLVGIFSFAPSSSELTPEMKEYLDSLAKQMLGSKNKRITLFSYASTVPSLLGQERQISLRRALQIRSYLSQNGIRSLRVEVRSLGSKGAGDVLPDRTDILLYDR